MDPWKIGWEVNAALPHDSMLRSIGWGLRLSVCLSVNRASSVHNCRALENLKGLHCYGLEKARGVQLLSQTMSSSLVLLHVVFRFFCSCDAGVSETIISSSLLSLVRCDSRVFSCVSVLPLQHCFGSCIWTANLGQDEVTPVEAGPEACGEACCNDPTCEARCW